MDLWKKKKKWGLWDAGELRDLLGFSMGFSQENLWLDLSWCRMSMEGIFCLLLFPCWKKKKIQKYLRFFFFFFFLLVVLACKIPGIF